MTAAKIMDIKSRLPGCAGQTADAISAYTQVKWRMLTNYWKFPNRNVQTLGFVYHDKNGLNHGPVWKIQSFFLSEICTVILWQDCYGEGNVRKSCCNTVGRRFLIGNAYSYTVKKRLFLSVYVDDIKLAGKKQNINPFWKRSRFGRTNIFPASCILGCTQRQCEISKDIVDNNRTMFYSRFSAGGTEKLPYSEIFRFCSWSFEMEGRAKKCVERYCELANKTTQQLCKVSTPCIDDHHFEEEEMKSVGELSQVRSQIVLKCLFGT